MNNIKGFTLVETILAISIVGIISINVFNILNQNNLVAVITNNKSQDNQISGELIEALKYSSRTGKSLSVFNIDAQDVLKEIENKLEYRGDIIIKNKIKRINISYDKRYKYLDRLNLEIIDEDTNNEEKIQFLLLTN